MELRTSVALATGTALACAIALSAWDVAAGIVAAYVVWTCVRPRRGGFQ
jgi:hypothetical protein